MAKTDKIPSQNIVVTTKTADTAIQIGAEIAFYSTIRRGQPGNGSGAW